MESGPAIFTAMVFALFGAAMLAWVTVRVRQGQPVAAGVRPVASAGLAALAGAVSLVLGVWCFAHL
ncbi:hypothetical protein [Streptomyces mangrovisoli]|uniref:Uncharacterized protein n=1 Tax=Streptomyces mangrovisoli TaxID=1428628 RepID=A0A1J4P7I3_9ACTN|nr:hypothetical protein [Streptomyces mangrovisoli]OIJ69716.1 hypothetical protein WN71_002270 [Streptomyces mangrovisoli]